ncbi:MAG: M20/M25/M40 family metallo-hydrolase, partial [Clostridia bacterium]|nr:M20/M25/M40 family metallo-hydrolase [Clostridia bacterium]
FGFALTQLSSSPPWPVRPGSQLVEICRKHFRELFGREIAVEPVHAGLECGGFSRKNPDLDIISIGPDILDIHSPKETLVLKTVYDCDALVRSMLREIAEE